MGIEAGPGMHWQWAVAEHEHEAVTIIDTIHNNNTSDTVDTITIIEAVTSNIHNNNTSYNIATIIIHTIATIAIIATIRCYNF